MLILTKAFHPCDERHVRHRNLTAPGQIFMNRNETSPQDGSVPTQPRRTFKASSRALCRLPILKQPPLPVTWINAHIAIRNLGQSLEKSGNRKVIEARQSLLTTFRNESTGPGGRRPPRSTRSRWITAYFSPSSSLRVISSACRSTSASPRGSFILMPLVLPSMFTYMRTYIERSRGD